MTLAPRRTIWPTIMILLAVLVSSAGCGSSPAERAYVARTTFNAAVAEANQLRAAGKIPDRQYIAIYTAEKATAAALDDADDAVASGSSLKWAGVSNELSDDLADMLQRLAAYRQPPKVK